MNGIINIRSTLVFILPLLFGCTVLESEQNTESILTEIANDPVQLREFLKQFPKGGDLHNHLDGAVYAESYLKWAELDGKCIEVASSTLLPPPCDPESGIVPVSEITRDTTSFNSAVDAMSVRNYQDSSRNGHDQFFSAFRKFSQGVTGREGYMLAEVVQRAAEQNIGYLELIVVFGMSDAAAWAADYQGSDVTVLSAKAARSKRLEEISREVIELTDRAEAEQFSLLECGSKKRKAGCNVTVRYIPAVIRVLPRQIVVAQTALAFRLVQEDSRYVAINFVAPEDAPVALADYDWHMELIRKLSREHPAVGGNITLHAGELAPGLVPPEYLENHIEKAINTAGARRIGHGTSIQYERGFRDLLKQMSDERILVEINLTSNDVILGVSGDQHPFSLYREYDVPMALSTDDEGIARIDLTHEYQRAVESYKLDYGSLKSMSRNSLEYAFVDGGSLFADTSPYIIVDECINTAPDEKNVDSTCEKYLDNNAKARLQWALEKQFLRFEHTIRESAGDIHP